MTGLLEKFLDDRGANAPHSKQSLRLWLKILGCATVVEKTLRNRLAQEFGSTLPRFDVLAALDRDPEGLTMSELSSRLLVSNGNVTGLVTRLQQDGLVERRANEQDRRVFRVRLTNRGREAFRRMAAVHEGWVEGMFAELSDEEIAQLLTLLARAQHSIGSAVNENQDKNEDEE
ncbi:MAG: MarR family transcriptional regulator [Parvularculaceae bacterium]